MNLWILENPFKPSANTIKSVTLSHKAIKCRNQWSLIVPKALEIKLNHTKAVFKLINNIDFLDFNLASCPRLRGSKYMKNNKMIKTSSVVQLYSKCNLVIPHKIAKIECWWGPRYNMSSRHVEHKHYWSFTLLNKHNIVRLVRVFIFKLSSCF